MEGVEMKEFGGKKSVVATKTKKRTEDGCCEDVIGDGGSPTFV